MNDYPECGRIERVDTDEYLSERGLVAWPVELTEVMLKAAQNEADECCSVVQRETVIAMFNAMILAAQGEG